MIDALRYVLAPLVAAVVGGLVVHLAARRRDLENDRRKQRIDYLVTAYRHLASVAHRDLTRDYAITFENAMSDIMLLGGADQVFLARNVIQNFAAAGGASLDDLLVSLRSELRSQLGLTADELAGIPTVRVGAADATGPLGVDELYVALGRAQEQIVRNLLATSNRPQSDLEARPLRRDLDDADELADTDPGASVDSAYRALSVAVRQLLDANLSDDLLGLVRTGVQEGVITRESARAIEGLHIMRALGLPPDDDGARRSQRAHEYAAMVNAILYAINSSARRM